MKQIHSLLAGLAFIALTSLTACNKDDAPNNPGGSGSLDAGKASVSLNTSADFAGSTSFSVSNTAATTAVTGSSAALRNISVSATEISGTNTRSVMITIIAPVDASTSGGNLSADLSLPTGAVLLPTITLTSTNGASAGTSYGSESGTLTITKLTATEIEGTFSGVVKDVTGSATMNISNGSFAGKF